MSSFLSQVGTIGQSFGHSLNQKIGQGLNQSVEELRVGKFSVVVKERLAEGGFGVIDLVSEVHSNQELALKRCNIDRPEVFDIVKKEISILQEFSSPYVAKLVDSAIFERSHNSREALILMEYYPGGHLLDRLNKRNGASLPLDSIYRIFGYILLGVKPFHEHNPVIIHRDLKLENVLFGTDGKSRLCDFGSCKEGPIFLRDARERQLAEESIQKETTQMYRAPEMVDLYMRDVLTEKTDVWALGCMLYSLCFLKHPFQDQSSLAIIAGKFQIPKNSTFPTEVHELIFRMLDIDPEARPSVSELLYCTVELAAGRPLPPHSLSEEALLRRAKRAEADKFKEAKNKKKTAPNELSVPRKSAAPSADSVAARRMAAKRNMTAPTPQGSFGDSSPTFAHFPTPVKNDFIDNAAPVDDCQVTFAEFDFFDTSPKPDSNSQTLNFHTTPHIVENTFGNDDAFGNESTWDEFGEDGFSGVSQPAVAPPSSSGPAKDENLLSFDQFAAFDVPQTRIADIFDDQPVLTPSTPFPTPVKGFASAPMNQGYGRTKSDPLELFDSCNFTQTPSVNIRSGFPNNSNSGNTMANQTFPSQNKVYSTGISSSRPYQAKKSDPFDSLNILQK